jgi:hypothetical protein
MFKYGETGRKNDVCAYVDRLTVAFVKDIAKHFRHLHEIPSFCLSVSVCLSVRMKQLGSHRTDFHEIWYLNIFRKSVEKFQVSLQSDKNNGYFTCRPLYIYDNISLSSS